ncbi:arylamine N-acetyltransferase family protein [Jiangella asiatica]|uniref:Arylamine N-acetyltransferase n=1 Tax=Jiangella asiatica TaxID=2530372 RepID=A0A4V2Z3Q5_9ACTN|nr:arylamine N-acetyltransferase [Jiangella asiatica]TDE13538.1 arylamine N-acetyltransferase [Jiangella asiatica]
MSADQWYVDRLDLAGYLKRVGAAVREPSRAALDELHEAHVRTFTFDNIDVLLQQHPGAGLDAIQGKFVGRGRGGYCFEHATIFAAALERLGYDVRRHLGRVGDPADGSQQGRTHMVVEVVLDGQRLLCDTGFGMSVLRPIPLADGAEDDHRGWRYRIDRNSGTWEMRRWRDEGWLMMHTTDELTVLPVDVAIGHHYTSTHPASHFTRTLVIARHLPGRHVTVTHETVTVRRADAPTEHRPLGEGELTEWLRVLEVPLTGDEERRLLGRVATVRTART